MSNGNNGNGWTEENVRRVLLNPVHTMGNQPTIDDATWIRAQMKLAAEVGQEAYFVELLAVLQETFGELVE